ncbi:MAG: hypothetical protein J7M24_04880 [Candidatus Latescibacteria bacterium]|nr:hypothetical protein [Candidatus Latescibacterota bacterium]
MGTRYFLRLAFCTAVAAASLWEGKVWAKGGPDYMGHIISNYRSGEYDAALDYIEVEQQLRKTSPLSKYYSARIRALRGNGKAAMTDIIAAIEDSAGFADAVAFQACLLKQAGSNGTAIRKWSEFLGLLGIEPAGPVTVESIVPPEEFAERVKQEGYGAPVDSASDSSAKAEERYKELMPMSVIDLVELRKQQNAPPPEIAPQEAETGKKTWMLPVAGTVVMLFLLLLVAGRRRRVEKAVDRTETGAAPTAAAPAPGATAGQAEEPAHLQPDGASEMVLLPDDDSPFARALRLKEERRRRAGEIDRLLNKL